MPRSFGVSGFKAFRLSEIRGFRGCCRGLVEEILKVGTSRGHAYVWKYVYISGSGPIRKRVHMPHIYVHI